jgi:hypothetical protein
MIGRVKLSVILEYLSEKGGEKSRQGAAQGLCAAVVRLPRGMWVARFSTRRPRIRGRQHPWSAWRTFFSN